MAMIYQEISEELLLTLAERTTAKQVWAAIKTTSLGADRVKKFKAQTLKAEFESLKMNETEQLDDFYLKLNGWVAKIMALGESIGEKYVVKKILRAVPTKFLQIASTLEQFGQGESKEGQQLLINEEEWSKYEASSGKLLLTREEWLQISNRGGNGFHGRDNQGGHDRIDRSKIKCFNCGAYGHFAAECRKPKRDKVHRGKVHLSQTADDEPALLMTISKETTNGVILLSEGSKSNTKEETDNMWYLDNGASNHMTGCREKIEKLDKTLRGHVKFGDGSRVQIEGKGTINMVDNGKRLACISGVSNGVLQQLQCCPFESL
ncbi:uncharacterized protein LOC141703180 [Apium graveolens]|uniref:uncharacterized protein LOC141703180 n=1 Tax=Apium graveolens TaxID=4045 RepID=UPI003D7A8A12